MQVSVESTGALERRMEVQVPAAQIEKAVDERLQRLSRTVRLKGFRPGKVPVKVVRQQFGQQVRQEVLGDVDAVELRRGGRAGKADAGGRPAHRADQRRRGRGSQVPRRVRDPAADRAQGSRQLQVERPVGGRHRRPTSTR